VQTIAQVFSSHKRLMYGYLRIPRCPTLILNHSGREFTPFAKRQRVAVGGEHLNANVVGAGGVMLTNTISDCIEITYRSPKSIGQTSACCSVAVAYSRLQS
jgi:hypothetical protein